jgi:hypothetical protein
MDAMFPLKTGPTQARWASAMRDKAFDLIRSRKLMETAAEHFLQVLNVGTISTNMFLRRLHNFAVGMHWLPWPVLPKLKWPAVEHKERRAITADEHQRIIEREHNPEIRAYYQLLWHLGGSQTDIADCAFNQAPISGLNSSNRENKRSSGGPCSPNLGFEPTPIKSFGRKPKSRTLQAPAPPPIECERWLGTEEFGHAVRVQLKNWLGLNVPRD